MKVIKKSIIREKLVMYILLLPSIAGLLTFYVVPFLTSLYLAVLDNNLTRHFVGLKNIIGILQNGAFQLALKNTLIFLCICIPLNMIIPLMLAVFLNRLPKKHRRLLAPLFLVPLVIPSGSMIFFWQKLVGFNGMLNGMFNSQMPVDWLNSNYSMLFIVFIFIWKNAGYNIILFSAGLDFIPKDYYECAAIEGAGAIRQFFSITLIYLIPTSVLVLVMSVINSFKVFKEIYLLTGAYPFKSVYLLQHYMNNQFSALNYQKLSSASFIVFMFVVLVVYILINLQKKYVE